MIKQLHDFTPSWYDIGKQLQRSLKYAQGDLDITDLFVGISEGIYQLWDVCGRGYAVTTVQSYPQKRVLQIIALAGKDVIQDLTDDEAFLLYIKRCFAVTQIEAMCRTSMVKLVKRVGFKVKYHVVTLDIGD